MPPTLAATLHYPNSWHNTNVKNWSQLIPQVHFQPLPKLPVITPPTNFVLIIQWQPSTMNPSTPPCLNKIVLITHLQIKLVKPTFETL